MKLLNLSEFRNVVVYVGGNNATNNLVMNEAYEYFEERLDYSITYIKRGNNECKIYMCPRGDKRE